MSKERENSTLFGRYGQENLSGQPASSIWAVKPKSLSQDSNVETHAVNALPLRLSFADPKAKATEPELSASKFSVLEDNKIAQGALWFAALAIVAVPLWSVLSANDEDEDPVKPSGVEHTELEPEPPVGLPVVPEAEKETPKEPVQTAYDREVERLVTEMRERAAAAEVERLRAQEAERQRIVQLKREMEIVLAAEEKRKADLLALSSAGCEGSVSGEFTQFWVAGLDQSDAFTSFEREYNKRLNLGRAVDAGSARIYTKPMQEALALNGCYTNTNERHNDGSYGQGTREAVARFQAANGLPETGILDAKTADHLSHATTMRILFNIHALDAAAKHFGRDTSDVLQVAWHESFYNHMLDSGTGPEGIGQMTDGTFLAELKNMKHPFYAVYRAEIAKGGKARTQAKAQLEEMKHSVAMGALAMVSHCDTLMRSWNKATCAKAYPIYQLGAGDYLKLKRAASRNPGALARRVSRGTAVNNYGGLSARRAFAKISVMVDSKADRARAATDFGNYQALVEERARLLAADAQWRASFNAKYGGLKS